MSFGIFLRVARALFEFMLQLAEHVCQIHARGFHFLCGRRKIGRQSALFGRLIRESRGCVLQSRRGRCSGCGGTKLSPSEASRSETNSPNTPADAASGVAWAYPVRAGSAAGIIVRRGIAGN